MYVPFITSCGHSFCYGCITNWFQNKLNCPTCRTDLEQPPSLNVQLRTISRSITELMAEVSGPVQGQQMLNAMTDANEEYQRSYESGDLFEGIFKKLALTLIDNSDGVPRCGNCHWEAHGSSCLHCGTRFRISRDDDYYDSDDGDAYDEDENENDNAGDGDGEDGGDDVNEYDSDDSFVDNRGDGEIRADLLNDVSYLSLGGEEGEWGGFGSGIEDEIINVDELDENADDIEILDEADDEDLSGALNRFGSHVVDDDLDVVTLIDGSRSRRSRAITISDDED